MTMAGTTEQGGSNNLVGPVFRPGELADAAIEALEEDNPGREFNVDDRVGYIRVETESECVIQRATMEAILGRPFEMQELEVILGSFAGRIQTEEEFMRFYFIMTD
ncbi:MAG: MmoB/DmpM family protein [Gammaproteobacteria bacterium]|nr:MmoB/DmpM family protein [Gammaproteobacteria bacterium]